MGNSQFTIRISIGLCVWPLSEILLPPKYIWLTHPIESVDIFRLRCLVNIQRIPLAEQCLQKGTFWRAVSSSPGKSFYLIPTPRGHLLSSLCVWDLGDSLQWLNWWLSPVPGPISHLGDTGSLPLPISGPHLLFFPCSSWNLWHWTCISSQHPSTPVIVKLWSQPAVLASAGVVGKQWPPKEAHVLIPGTCEFVKLHGNRKLR